MGRDVAEGEVTKRETGRCIQCNTNYSAQRPCKCGANASLRDNRQPKVRRMPLREVQ
jgi:hypothetical protein